MGVVENSVFSLGVLKYAVCLCRGCDEAVGARVWEA